MVYAAELIVAPSKSDVGVALCRQIVSHAQQALTAKHSFTLALSGGSLPFLLAGLPHAFQTAGVDPQWYHWHIFLADERCVPLSSPDSNLHAIQTHFLSQVAIPASQIHGISQALISADESPDVIAQDYERTLRHILTTHSTHDLLDLAILGFGPDGHTCSLFPTHDAVLGEPTRWVVPVTDSPKPPSNRITLTFPVLNHQTNHVIVCGTGPSKQPIVRHVFSTSDVKPSKTGGDVFPAHAYEAPLSQPPPPFPCAMVHPLQSLTWIVDQEAVAGLGLLPPATAQILVQPTPTDTGMELCHQLVDLSHEAITRRGAFTIALSGGSLPRLLTKLPHAFVEAGIDPHYEKWHVVLADERGVPEDHRDSNMGMIRKYFLNQPSVHIPNNQVHGLDQISLGESIVVAAQSYHRVVTSALTHTGGLLDVAVLGFGDDGHTCSLFPNHPLVVQAHHDDDHEVRSRLVAAMTDSPKAPSHRVTLTFRTLNDLTRNVVFCGTGTSKSPILHDIFQEPYYNYNYNYSESETATATASRSNSPTGKVHVQADMHPVYPCGMVRPKHRLLYVVDAAAMSSVYIAPSKDAADQDAARRKVPRRKASTLPQPPSAKVVVVNKKKDAMAIELCAQIVRYCSIAMAARKAFSIALSGGSLPGLLSHLPQAFTDAGVDPQYHAWHVLLADERCVPSDHPDSNMYALRQSFLNQLRSYQEHQQIPHNQIYRLDQVAVGESIAVAAQDYETKLHTALSHTDGMLDLAVLGFGPDGHTCSLFPGQSAILNERTQWVLPVTNSPKPPANRITMTLAVLNDQRTRNVMFCGAGASKAPILQHVLQGLQPHGLDWAANLTVPPPYPCAMIRPAHDLLYVVDEAAMDGVAGYASPTATATSRPTQYAKVVVAPSKAELPDKLNPLLVQESQKAIAQRGVFTIALSGGSLPSLLSRLPDAFRRMNVTPQWDKWHVLLADERCVPRTSVDSNLGAIQNEFLNHVTIPPHQVYGMDESKLLLGVVVDVDAIAQDYESKLRHAMALAGGYLDVAVLGFGPDGHTCSLFPNHALLHESRKWVAGIADSPKSPPHRITLTFRVLNDYTRTILMCGAGASKAPVLTQVFGTKVVARQGADCHLAIQPPPPPPSALLPCAMVRPNDRLIWVVDTEAMPKELRS